MWCFTQNKIDHYSFEFIDLSIYLLIIGTLATNFNKIVIKKAKIFID